MQAVFLMEARLPDYVCTQCLNPDPADLAFSSTGEGRSLTKCSS